MLRIFISFSSLKGFITKNGMLFDRHDSLYSKYVNGIEQSLLVVFKTKTPAMNLAKDDEKQMDFRLNT